MSLCGKIHIDEEDHFSIRIHTENVAVARKYFTLLKNTFNIKADISIRRNAFLKKSRSYTLLVRDHENALRVLKADNGVKKVWETSYKSVGAKESKEGDETTGGGLAWGGGWI